MADAGLPSRVPLCGLGMVPPDRTYSNRDDLSQFLPQKPVDVRLPLRPRSHLDSNGPLCGAVKRSCRGQNKALFPQKRGLYQPKTATADLTVMPPSGFCAVGGRWQHRTLAKTALREAPVTKGFSCFPCHLALSARSWDFGQIEEQLVNVRV